MDQITRKAAFIMKFGLIGEAVFFSIVIALALAL
jgi:hypothetical protein